MVQFGNKEDMHSVYKAMGCGISMKSREGREKTGKYSSSGPDEAFKRSSLSLTRQLEVTQPIELYLEKKLAERNKQSIPNQNVIDLSHFYTDIVLGVGGFGLVRLALRVSNMNENQTNVYAVKTIPKSNVLSKTNGITSIYNELNCLKVLSKCKFICRAHYAFTDSRQLYLVLEYCGGGDFRICLRKQPRGIFSEEVARFYISQCIRKYTH